MGDKLVVACDCVLMLVRDADSQLRQAICISFCALDRSQCHAMQMSLYVRKGVSHANCSQTAWVQLTQSQANVNIDGIKPLVNTLQAMLLAVSHLRN